MLRRHRPAGLALADELAISCRCPDVCLTKVRSMKTFAALLFGLALGAWPSLAHHSFAAEYDDTKPVKISGVVTKVEWTNPHIWFYVDAKDADGKVAHWAFSGGAPGQLMRRGISKDVIQPGMMINV